VINAQLSRLGSWEWSLDDAESVPVVPAEIRIGAIRRFFGCCVAVAESEPLLSSFSDSLVAGASRLPSTLPIDGVAALGRGVCGGVVRGRPEGCAECVAVTEGTEPSVGVGLLMTVADCWVDDCVATEPAELDRAGLAGGTWPLLAAGKPPLLTGAWVALIGDGTCVGVGKGVILVEGVLELSGFKPVDVAPVYT
jgi:hypothetical protein